MTATCFLLALAASVSVSSAAVLFNDPTNYLINDTGVGTNIPGMAVSRDNTASGTLYFQYTVVNPRSNSTTEGYYAGMNFFSGGAEGIGMGNSQGAWAYSAWNTSVGDFNSSTPETAVNYQLVRPSDVTLIVFRIDFVAGGDDNITVWLNPNLSLTEGAQLPSLTTTMTGNGSFDALHLREGNDPTGAGAGAAGWNFTGIAIAENGTDAGFFAAPEAGASSLLLVATGLLAARRRRVGAI